MWRKKYLGPARTTFPAPSGLRLLTTHVLDDAPSGTLPGPFHVHLGPDVNADDVTNAVALLLSPAPNSDFVDLGRPSMARAPSNSARRDAAERTGSLPGRAVGSRAPSTSASVRTVGSTVTAATTLAAAVVTEITEDSLSGRFLVARPGVDDPNFERTVVLILDHDEGGTLGVVVNRPSTAMVAQVLPAWADLVTGPATVFLGGPVEPSSGLCIGLIAPGDAAPTSAGVRRVRGPVCLVNLEQPPHREEMLFLRIFAGYASWTGGELRQQLEKGVWDVVGLDPGALLFLDAAQMEEAARAAPSVRVKPTVTTKPSAG